MKHPEIVSPPLPQDLPQWWNQWVEFVRRSPEEIAAENNKLLAFIRSNPGLRSEDILKALGLPKPNVASGLQRLRDEGKVRMVGVKRAATYTVA